MFKLLSLSLHFDQRHMLITYRMCWFMRFFKKKKKSLSLLINGHNCVALLHIVIDYWLSILWRFFDSLLTSRNANKIPTTVFDLMWLTVDINAPIKYSVPIFIELVQDAPSIYSYSWNIYSCVMFMSWALHLQLSWRALLSSTQWISYSKLVS